MTGSGHLPLPRAAPRPGPGPAAGEPLPGSLLLELVAAVIQSGLSPSAAVTSVGRALVESGDERGRLLLEVAPHLGARAAPADAGDPDGAAPGGLVEGLVEGLDLAVRAGVAPAAMVRRAAVMLRRRQAVAQQRAIRKLEIWLVAPAGLCWLPAFVLVGVVPLVIDLFRH